MRDISNSFTRRWLFHVYLSTQTSIYYTAKKKDVTYKDPSHVQQNKKVNTLAVGHLQGFKLQITWRQRQPLLQLFLCHVYLIVNHMTSSGSKQSIWLTIQKLGIYLIYNKKEDVNPLYVNTLNSPAKWNLTSVWIPRLTSDSLGLDRTYSTGFEFQSEQISKNMLS